MSGVEHGGHFACVVLILWAWACAVSYMILETSVLNFLLHSYSCYGDEHALPYFMQRWISRTKILLGGVPVPTAWHVLGLRMEERPPAMEVSCEYIE
jgi:hypothetical protein